MIALGHWAGNDKSKILVRETILNELHARSIWVVERNRLPTLCIRPSPHPPRSVYTVPICPWVQVICLLSLLISNRPSRCRNMSSEDPNLARSAHEKTQPSVGDPGYGVIDDIILTAY